MYRMPPGDYKSGGQQVLVYEYFDAQFIRSTPSAGLTSPTLMPSNETLLLQSKYRFTSLNFWWIFRENG